MLDDYIDAGFRVFGLYGKYDHEGRDLPPKEQFKKPRISNWQHTPDWSDEQLDMMRKSGQFDTGFGVLVAGHLVIDVDARNGGVESFAALCKDLSIDLLAESGFAVQTGSGGGSMHIYYDVDPDIALCQSHPKYKGIDFKTSGFVVGAGSYHASGMVYEAIDGNPCDITPAPSALLELLKKSDKFRTEHEGMAVDVSISDIDGMLAHCDPDTDYEAWIRIGMAVHHATHGDGFDLWDSWSAKSEKYERTTMAKHWHSFGKSANPVTISTLIHYAKEGGWRAPVTFECDAPLPEPPPSPLDISGIDLTRPPGFVGEVASWIESQSRRPREHIAVAGALVAMGNILGLKYTDAKNRTTTNLFAFCVAASRTGKESIQQAVNEIHRAVGIHKASHGSIKSEQEIVRNLVAHQPAYYVIDEIGLYLQKIRNAQQKGGAAYLEGVIGMLMSAYSKADSYLLLTGDAKREMRVELMREASQIEKKLDEGKNRFLERRLEGIEFALEHLDNGIKAPFVSMIGFTTPVTFDDLVDFNTATNGFIGRSLLFNERETAPRSKKGFSRRPMPVSMQNTLKSLYLNGEYDDASPRIEYMQERTSVPVSDSASTLLDSIVDWLEDRAIDQKGVTGLESLYLGAYELVVKIALILGAPHGLIDVEHVRWAFALVRRDVEEKARLVTANDRQKDSPEMALQAKIINIVASEEGELMSVIKNRLRKSVRPEDVEQMVKKMVVDGSLLEVPYKRSFRYRYRE